ncbi:MAG: cation diffusion facilitator family transporter [Bacteroidia bacterium]
MSTSKISLYGALCANAAIAIIKFAAAVFSGSSAMLSEGIHSAVDTSNELLLLLGVRRSKKPADKNHPFGYGHELYFWSLIVAILFFCLGGGISIYEGINHIQNPQLIKNPFWNYIVLASAFLFDAISLSISLYNFLKPPQPKINFWKKLHLSKDPGFFVIIFEDMADLIGVSLAFTGIVLSVYFQNPVYDGIASILIGTVLATVAIILIIESRSLIIGESAKESVIKEIYLIVNSDADVIGLNPPLTMHLSPHDILLALEVRFTNDLKTANLEKAISRLKQNIKNKLPEIKHIYITVSSLK